MLPIKRTARQRLETFANISRIQPDEETYDLERTVVGSVVAGITADRCGQRGAGNRYVVPVDVGDGETDDVEMTLLERVKEAEAERDRLRAELAKHQESEFHPDWSMLEATRASLREHMEIIRGLRAELAAWENRAGVYMDERDRLLELLREARFMWVDDHSDLANRIDAALKEKKE